MFIGGLSYEKLFSDCSCENECSLFFWNAFLLLTAPNMFLCLFELLRLLDCWNGYRVFFAGGKSS